MEETKKPKNLYNMDNDVNNLTTDDVFRVVNLEKYKKFSIFKHNTDSYNKFIEEDLTNYLENENHIFSEVLTSTSYHNNYFKASNIKIQCPMFDNGIEPLFPSAARHHNLTYSIKIFADTIQYQDTIDIASDEKTTKQIGNKQENVLWAIIPLMIRSKWCTLTTNKGIDKNECDYDPGCCFLVKGVEKIVLPQDRKIDNKPFVSTSKDIGLNVQVNSRSSRDKGIIQPVLVRIKKDNELMIRVPILSEVNVVVLLKALGLDTDRNIINYITHDDQDTDMMEILRASFENCVSEKNNKISTQDEALDFLISKMKIIKKYSESNKETKRTQQKKFLLNLLSTKLLPHVDGSSVQEMTNKAYYICYMINRLLRVHLGRIPIDDRDSYVNKRVDLPGDLMFELYKQQHKKMLGECKRFFDSRNKSNDTPIFIVNYIKPNIIEQGFNAALSTGLWLRKQGVAQMMQSLSYLYRITLLRRVDAPDSNSSTMKLTGPRHLHPSSVPFLCCIQTPEHAKVGLTKHLSMMGSITIMSKEQFFLINDYMKKNTRKISEFSPEKIRDGNLYKVFLNGDWIGMTDKTTELCGEMEKMRMQGYFDMKNTSIVRDDDEGEVRVYCDSGRLVRPVLRVENNVLALKKSHIDKISLNISDRNKGKITTWEEFLIQYPETVDYLDSELQPYVIVADKIKRVEAMRQRMISSIDKVKKINSSHVENRYDDMMYIKYKYCEFHPSLLIGEIITNVPFAHMNPGVRNIFQYAQGKHAMTIYATNYRTRLDISYILYKPQRSLVHTRTSVYTNTRILPPGENCLVAIGCYMGYNQEDSLIFNKTSIQRGKFRAMSVKKFNQQVQKNQSTAQDDILTKPDPSKVSGIKYGSYDKLNDKGYVEQETVIEYGDVIFGKITPISNYETDKPYRDTSEIYKVGVPGVMDRVYLDTSTQDGYEIRKACIRSERIPKVGDKYCCYDEKTELLTKSGWKYFKDLTLNDKVATLINGNALEYREIVDIFVYEHNGEMYKVKSNQIDLLVTLNHRMYVKNMGNDVFSVKEARDIVNECVHYKKNVDNYNVFENIDENIDEQIVKFNATSEKLPSWVWTLTTNKAKIILNTMTQNENYETTSIILANDFQRLCLHCGYSSNMTTTYKNDKIKSYILTIVKTDNEPTVNDGDFQDEIVEYNGIIYCCKVKEDKNNTSDGLLYVRRNGMTVWSGNTYHGQKGTVGILIDENDMPFNKFGLKPDVILSPCAIPSRMTIGQLAECLVGKTAILQGKDADGTPFEDYDFVSVEDTLEKLGYERKGKEYLTNGMTGEKMIVEYFFGPTYYQRLKHLVHDKIHCLSMDHEVLTENGWKFFNDIKDGEKVATLKDDKLVYDVPTKLLYYPDFEGEMYKIETRQINLNVTLNHRMWASIDNNKFTHILAKDVVGKNIKYKNLDGEICVNTNDEKIEVIYDCKMPVFCLQVPSEVFYVRRNGIPVWTGNSRARGPKTLLTRQAPEGRSRDGGLRLGEMERDALLTHGLSKFIKEKLLDNSDAYITYVCDKCGLFAQRCSNRKNEEFPQDDDTYHCPACENFNDISKVKIPYAFKLLIHELMALNIAPRIRCQKELYN